MDYHNQSPQQVLQALQSDDHRGLTAQQAQQRQAQYGPNQLRGKKKKSLLRRFAEQFIDPMILILLAAAAVSFGVACYEGQWEDFFEPVLILLIVVANAVMGVAQENKADKALEALQSLSAPHARVLREGAEQVIDAAGLVPGDVIQLEAGDFIPADARLLTASRLQCEESALTGESVPADKNAGAAVPADAALGDRVTMVYSGCAVTDGTATAVVTATGMQTQMGRIANLLDQEDDNSTPLQHRLAQLSKYLGVAALAACAVIFGIGLSSGIPLLEIFMTAVSLAVSAIPEGLPAIVTIVLAMGVQRMVKRNAIIRRLPAVETLGSASVICSDKTGTLTQNRMTLVKVYLDGGVTENVSENNSPDARRLLEYGVLCSNGTVRFDSEGEHAIGDPTETAIVVAAHRNGLEQAALGERFPRLLELPFDSDRKRMSVVCRVDGRLLTITKGAFDMMVPLCVQGDLEAARRANDAMSADALRVLAVGYRWLDALPEQADTAALEQGLTFAGLVGMIDPPRPEAEQAVALCRQAGIRPVMITGDHVITASAIARELGILRAGDRALPGAELGILRAGDRAITGAELDSMDEDTLRREVDQISVYARVSPENKIRIVKAWQSRGEVVAMTGDGVNDAPALKAADIGCAMGITGTDVAKGAADVTLTDDNFATIVDAVREGRGIYANIRKVVGFLLGTNIGEVLTVFTAMLLWHKTPLLSMQLLWINLVTDGLPAVALGVEPVEPEIMSQPPKPRSEGIFAHGMGLRVALQGLMFGALPLLAFRLGEQVTGRLAGGQTMAFMVLALSQIVQAYNMRSEHSLFRIGFFGNKKLNMAALLSLALVLLVLLTPVSVAFGLIALPWRLYLAGAGLTLSPLVIMELAKAVMALTKKDRS